ncbi:DUF58 domain-containing protein [Salegentibacter sp. T436]|uniref:DUF58 domain-containing protein n=1 Tax=Salegentibacter sp. T436 TaxID=1729720 RepID=UPI00094A81E6|nr:DUF58 domain-containing protein [Salegentibacter sp. T436]APS40006.1 cell division protein FtsB [Salegentibacter sp. T436]
MLNFLKSLYLNQRFFYAIFAIALLFLFSYFFDFLYGFTWVLSLILLLFFLAELVSLYKSNRINAERILPQKFSNSDENEVEIILENNYGFSIYTEIIDEIPIQFQKRDFLKQLKIGAGNSEKFSYYLRPVARGEYYFGKLNIYVFTKIGLVKRRSVFGNKQMLKVYPSFIQMKKLDFLAIDNRLSQPGLKKIRRIGHTMEFEQIKEYVPGDDVRTINWKATAKQGDLMVNQFQDEKAQPIYSIIDTGRVMKMPFNGLSLLDYAINSSLAFSNIALKKKDKVGLISFSSRIGNILKANAKLSQLQQIMERLYNINTQFPDSDFNMLYSNLRQRVTQRSLLMLYTNFEHISALKRQLPYLKAINKKHVLVVIFFENTELDKVISSSPENTTDMAHQVIAEGFAHDKKLMAAELRQHGINTLLTNPEDLSINAINKYLEIKARGIL